MTHSTVVVCIDPAYKDNVLERLDGMLQPFDEDPQDEDAPRRDYIEGPPNSFWSVEELQKEGALPGDDSLTWELVAREHNKKNGPQAPGQAAVDRDSVFLDADGRPFQWTTYPQTVEQDGGIVAGARWDWWSVGGRWTGYFDVKPEALGSPQLINGVPGTMGQRNADPSKCDGGPRGMLDFEGMRAGAARKAEADWTAFHNAMSPYPDTRGWSYFRGKIIDGGSYTIDDARHDYRSQPGRIALRGTAIALRGTAFEYFGDCPIDHFSPMLGPFTARAAAQEVPGYALLDLDGVWREPGRMGWLAMSDETDKSKAQYTEMANKYLDDLDPATILVVVDVHI